MSATGRTPSYSTLQNDPSVSASRRCVSNGGGVWSDDTERKRKLGAGERVRRLEELLGRGSSADVRRMIYEAIFRLAIQSKDGAAAVRYCKALRLFDPGDNFLGYDEQ